MLNLVKYISLIISILLGFRGLFEILNFNTGTNLIAFLLILFLFGLLVLREFKFPLFNTMIIFLITGLVSSYLGGINFLAFLSYNKTVLGVLVLFLFVLINGTNLETARKIKNYGILIIALQIPAYFIKFVLIGFSEDPVGTISMREGSATVHIALIGFSYFLIKYLISHQNKYLYIALIFIVISQINEKRAVIFLIPIFFLYINYQLSSMKGTLVRFIINKSYYFIVLLPFFIYLIAIVNPFLNPSGEFFGEFDLVFLITFISEYMYRPDLTVWDYGRMQSVIYVISVMLNADINQLLFGSGAGSIPAISGGVTESIGIRYGARMGFVWVIIQHGISGILIIVSAFISLFKTLKKYELHTNELKGEYLFLKTLAILFAFDFFFYSSVVVFYPIFTYIFIAQFNYVYKLCNANVV